MPSSESSAAVTSLAVLSSVEVALPSDRVEQVPLGQPAGRARHPSGGGGGAGHVVAVVPAEIDLVQYQAAGRGEVAGVHPGVVGVVADAETEVQAAAKHMTVQELEFANKIWAYLDSFLPEVAAVSPFPYPAASGAALNVAAWKVRSSGRVPGAIGAGTVARPEPLVR